MVGKNASVAVSPSASVAVSVYVVSAWGAVGVPLRVPLVVASAGAVYIKPGSNAGVNA